MKKTTFCLKPLTQFLHQVAPVPKRPLAGENANWLAPGDLLMGRIQKVNAFSVIYVRWVYESFFNFLPLSPPGWRGIVVTVRAGGRAGGCQTCGTHISVTAWWIFSVRSSMELSRPVVVHCHAHLPICPFAPYGLAHGPKTCQICHKLDPDFADRISLKPLDGFTPFKVSWTCLDL